MEEYVPVIEKIDQTLLVKEKIKRKDAHGKAPVYHATAIIVVLLPDGRILLADKTEKQRAKGKIISQTCHIYDTFGGHMRYEDIPEQEHFTGISLNTFRTCACRELEEELLVKERHTQKGVKVSEESLEVVGFYEMVNDHNKEYSWVFLYRVQRNADYISEDTLETQNGMRTIPQPVQAFSYEEIQDIFLKKRSGCILSDGLGRVLEQDDRLQKMIE